jgi:hypothetical protein
MSVDSTVRVPTAHASRYLQQLCKHWSHNLAVTFSESEGTVTFPRNARGADWPGDATLALQAHADGDCAAWRRVQRPAPRRCRAPSRAISTASPFASAAAVQLARQVTRTFADG